MIVRSLIAQWSSIVISIFLALFVWTVATNEENPSREAVFPDAIAVQFANRGEGLTLTDKSAETVHVHVRAPEASWQNLRATDFQATVDLKGSGPGEHSLPVLITTADPQATVTGVDPPTVKVTLERLKQTNVEVHVRVLDDPPLGYEYKNVTAQPPAVAISGPESLVDQVNDATVDLALRGAKTSVDREVNVTLHDAQGNVLQNLVVSPAAVSVHVDVVQRVGYKEVAVKAVLKGNVNSGYWVSDIRVDPPTVTLVGAADALDRIPGFVESQAVVITGAKEDVNKQVGLSLPSGITAFNTGSVNVHVAVEPLLGGVTIRRPVTISEVRCDLPATVSPDAVEVILSGPLPILQSLTQDDVQIVVDVNACSPISFQATPRWINVPDSVKVESIVPNTVEVNVRLR